MPEILRFQARVATGLAVFALLMLTGWVAAAIIDWIIRTSVGRALMGLLLGATAMVVLGVCYQIGDVLLETMQRGWTGS